MEARRRSTATQDRVCTNAPRGHHLVTDLQKSRRRTRRGHCLQWSVQGVEHKGQFGGVECTQVVADGLAASKNVWARPPAARKARCRDPMPERTTPPHHRRRARHRRTVRYSPPCPARHADPFNIHANRPTGPDFIPRISRIHPIRPVGEHREPRIIPTPSSQYVAPAGLEPAT